MTSDKLTVTCSRRDCWLLYLVFSLATFVAILISPRALQDRSLANLGPMLCFVLFDFLLPVGWELIWGRRAKAVDRIAVLMVSFGLLMSLAIGMNRIPELNHTSTVLIQQVCMWGAFIIAILMKQKVESDPTAKVVKPQDS